MDRQKDRLCNIYQYCTVRQLFRQVSKACSQAGNKAGLQVCQAGRQAVGKDGREGWEEGRKEGRKKGRMAGGQNAGGQEFRQTDNVQKDRCANIHTDIQKYRLTDIHRQTDRQAVQK